MSNSIRPTFVCKSVADINPEEFMIQFPYIKGVAWDIDKTLTGQHDTSVPEAHMRVMKGFSELGLLQGFASNAQSIERTERAQEIAADIGRHLSDRILVVTSMMVGGKRKPCTPVYDELAKRMDLQNHQIIHIGDQLLKDVWGANRAGYAGSVLVAPYGEGDVLMVRYFQRPAEAVLRLFMRDIPMRTKNFGMGGTLPQAMPAPLAPELEQVV